MSTNQKEPLKGRYIMVLIGSGMLSFLLFFTTTANSYYYTYIIKDYGFSLASIQLYYTILSFVGIIACPFIIKLVFSKLGLQKTIIILGVIEGIAYIGFSACSQLWMWYALAAVIGITSMPVTSIAPIYAVNSWFAERTGFMCGLCSAMSGVAGVIFGIVLPPVLTSSWRTAYLMSGVIIVAFSVISGVFFIRDSPAKCGMKPYGYDQMMAKNSASLNKSSVLRGVTAKTAFASAPFWFFILSALTLCIILAFVQSAVAYFMELGFSIEDAGRFLGVMAAALIVWKVLLGWLVDKIGAMWSYAIASIITATTTLLLIVSGNSNVFIPYLFVVGLAASSAVSGVVHPVINRELFGMKDYAQINSFMGLPMGIAVAVFAAVWGVLHATFGTYTVGLYIALGCLVASLLFIVLAYRASKSKAYQEKWEDA